MFRNPTSEIMAMKRLPKISTMTTNDALLALLAKHCFSEMKFSRGFEKDPKNLILARKFEFDRESLRFIMNRTHITTSEATIAMYFVLYSFLSWYWSETDRNLDDIIVLLEASLYACSGSSLVPAKVFMFLFGIYLDSFPALESFEQALGLFRSFFLQIPHLPANALRMFPPFLLRVRNSGQKANLTSLLVAGKAIVSKRLEEIPNDQAEFIAQKLSHLIPEPNLQALEMFAVLSVKLETSENANVLKRLSVEISNMALDSKEILIPSSSQEKSLAYEFKRDLGVIMSFEHVDTFVNGISTDSQIVLPPQISVEELLDDDLLPYVDVACKIVGSSISLCQVLTECIMNAINDNADHHNVLSLYAVFLSVCIRCMRSVGRLLLVSPSLCNPLLFDPSVVCTGTSDEVVNLNALRSAAFEIFLFEGIDTLCGVGSTYVPYPFLFCEYLKRCTANLREVQKLLTNESPFIGFISDVLLFTQKLRYDGCEEMDDVRIALIEFLSQCLADESIAYLFFIDARFVEVFVSLTFESPLSTFVISQITKFLTTSHNPGAIGSTLLSVFDTLLLSFPEPKSVSLAGSILSMLNELMKINRDALEESFTPLSDSLLFRIGSFVPSDECRQCFSHVLTFLSETARFSREHMELLLYRINILYPDGGVNLNLWSELIFLMAGERLPTLTPSFIIHCSFACRLWLEVFEKSERWEEAVVYLRKLCDFSVKNITSCHLGEVDLYLIEKIRAGHQEEFLFELLSVIATRVSSIPVVERFISLLSPVDGKPPQVFAKAMKTLANLVSLDMKEPRIVLPLVDENKVRMPDRLTITTGFSFCCWFYLESVSVKSFPLLLSLRSNDGKYFHIFVAGGVLQFSLSESPRTKSLATTTPLPVREWCLICVTYRVHNQYSYIVSRINNEPEEIIEKGTKRFPSGIVTMSFGGMVEESDKTEASSMLGPFGIFSVLGEEQIRLIWGKGPNRFDHEATDSLFIYKPQNRYHHRSSSMSRVLAAQCKLPILFPLFCVSDSVSESVLDALFDLITSMLLTNPDVESELKKEATLSLLSHIIGSQDSGVTIGYALYGKFVTMAQHLQTESVRAEMLKHIIMNLQFWTKAPFHDLLLILKHWSRTLIPSFQKFIVHPFSRVLDEMIIYFSPRQDNDEEMATYRKLMCQVCQDLAAVSFTFEDFKLISSYILALSDASLLADLVKLLSDLSMMNPCPFAACATEKRFIPVLLQLVKKPASSIPSISILVRMHYAEILPKSGISHTITAILSLTDDSIFTDEFFSGVLEMVPEIPELFSLCCVCAAKLGTSAVKKIFAEVKPSDALATDEFWPFWPMAMAVETKLNTGIMPFIAFCRLGDFVVPFLMIRMVGVILNKDLSHFQRDFLMIIGEQLVSGVLDSSHLKTFSRIVSSFIFFEDHPLQPNASIEKVWRDYYPYYDFTIHQKESPRGGFNVREILERTMEIDTDPKPQGFALHVNETGKWLDSDLAVMTVLLFHKYKFWDHLPFEALLLYFLADKRTDFVISCLNEFEFSNQAKDASSLYLKLLSSKLNSMGISHPNLTFEGIKDNTAAFVEFEKSGCERLQKSYRVLASNMSEYCRSQLNHIENLSSTPLSETLWMNSQNATLTDIALMEKNSALKWRQIHYSLTIPHSPFASMIPNSNERELCKTRNAWLCPARVKSKTIRKQDLATAKKCMELSSAASLVKPCKVVKGSEYINATVFVHPSRMNLRKGCFETWWCDFSTVKCVIPLKIGDEDTGLEILTKLGQSRVMIFDNFESRQSVYEMIVSRVPNECKRYEKVESCVCEDWKSHKISNFQFILYVNMCSNRSFSIPKQYPIFPTEAITARVPFSNLRNTGIYQEIEDVSQVPEHFYLAELFACDNPGAYVQANRKELESDRVSDLIPQWLKCHFGVDVERRAPKVHSIPHLFCTHAKVGRVLAYSQANYDDHFALFDETGTLVEFASEVSGVTEVLRMTLDEFFDEWTQVSFASPQHLVFKNHGSLFGFHTLSAKFVKIPRNGDILYAGNNFLVIGPSSSVIEVLDFSDFDRVCTPCALIPFYQHPVRCCYVSSTFRVIVVGCEFSCLVMPIEMARSSATVELGKYKPKQVIVTNAVGYVVTVGEAVKNGEERHCLFVHTINGTRVSKHRLVRRVGSIATWTDAILCDHIAYAYEGDRTVYASDVFSIEFKPVDCGNRNPVTHIVNAGLTIITSCGEICQTRTSDGKFCL